MLPAVALTLLLAPQALAIAPLAAKGSKLFYSDSGDQFFNKGVAYQLTDDDPLAQPDQCALDATLMQSLGANAIRVYHVEASLDHDACMQTFADAGIYTWIDLDTFDTYINGSSAQWTSYQYDAFTAVMDAFQKYDNVAGFFVGNEQLTVGTDSIAAPYLKAAARDMKAYRDRQGYRDIPIGYSAADIPDLRPNLQNYLACGDNSSEALDFYSLNAYEWCGDSSFSVSGYTFLQQNASEYNIPIFLSETGCNKPPPRLFQDQESILGSDMDGTWSGSIIYEWIEETNNYGLISYGPPAGSAAPTGAPLSGDGSVIGGYTRQGTPTPVLPDFTNLSNRWQTLSPTGVNSNDYQPSATPPACPSYTSGLWEIQGDVRLPTLGQRAADSTASNTQSGSSSEATGESETSGSSQSSDSSDSSATATTTSSDSGAAPTARFGRAWSAGAGLAGMGAVFVAL